jgi:hypothetical protein
VVLYHELDNAEGVSLCFVGFARLAAAQGDVALAVLLLSAATRLMRQHSFVMTAADQDAYGRTMAELRARINEDTFDRTWADGQTLTVDEAIGRALAAAGTPSLAPEKLPHD